jgi:hypothetical protein
MRESSTILGRDEDNPVRPLLDMNVEREWECGLRNSVRTYALLTSITDDRLISSQPPLLSSIYLCSRRFLVRVDQYIYQFGIEIATASNGIREVMRRTFLYDLSNRHVITVEGNQAQRDYNNNLLVALAT